MYKLSKIRRYYAIENTALIHGVRAGTIAGVGNRSLEGCAVVKGLAECDAFTEEWKVNWKLHHDGYDEVNQNRSAIVSDEGHCPTREGSHCGRYCCKSYREDDYIQ